MDKVQHLAWPTLYIGNSQCLWKNYNFPLAYFFAHDAAAWGLYRGLRPQDFSHFNALHCFLFELFPTLRRRNLILNCCSIKTFTFATTWAAPEEKQEGVGAAAFCAPLPLPLSPPVGPRKKFNGDKVPVFVTPFTRKNIHEAHIKHTYSNFRANLKQT